VCGENARSRSCSLIRGRIPCGCSPQRQKIAYINKILDSSDELIALKFGIATDPSKRVKDQNLHSSFIVENYLTFYFESVESCKKAERECLQELVCGVVLRRDFPDGYTETTWPYNLKRIIEIYERNGGVLNE
jgi:hypothetical protein